ncbi:sentrin-specific protease 1-like isoform X2 [Aethina tumida]|uniref:sentrin-specific protease 1-like isoform X2 n=1 Tax=Aethina tumida TaxID=116153 RepID=UPI0021489E7E|nr:sentrin-specific protease 1-like isoform X2 [Aethina tumida]
MGIILSTLMRSYQYIIERFRGKEPICDKVELEEVIIPSEETKEEEIHSQAGSVSSEESHEGYELAYLSSDHMKLLEWAYGTDDSLILMKKFSIKITGKDLRTITGSDWLSENIINFYMKLLSQRGKLEEWPSVFSMNTYFYPKILRHGIYSVQRWSKRIDIFSYDMICIPINMRYSWGVAIIDFKNKSIKYYDSLGNGNNVCLQVLLEYLEFEHWFKKKGLYDTTDFILENIMYVPPEMNEMNCSLFSCVFAELTTRNTWFPFNESHLPYLRNRIAVEILTGKLLIS